LHYWIVPGCVGGYNVGVTGDTGAEVETVIGGVSAFAEMGWNSETDVGWIVNY